MSEAMKKGMSKERMGAYVYGTMAKMEKKKKAKKSKKN